MLPSLQRQAFRAATRCRVNTGCVSTSFHHSSQSLQESEPPPIVWTTHRLTKEQIAKVDAIFHKLLWLDMFEISMVTEIVNERLGIKLTPKQKAALRKQMDARAAQRHGSATKTSKEKEEVADEAPKKVDLKLTGYDDKAKIKVIKEVRSIAGLGLKEAKELVESAPKVIQKDLKPEEAEELKKKLEEIGAQIELV